MRDEMIKARRERNLTRNALARIVECKEVLISIVENGGVTQPNIARRIGRVLGFTEEQTSKLMPPPRPPEIDAHIKGLKPHVIPRMQRAVIGQKKQPRKHEPNVAINVPVLERLLKAKGITKKDVNLALGKSHAWLSARMNYCSMSREQAEAVAQILGVSADEFLV